jgi:predicted ATPase
MLKKLTIKNFKAIENMTIEFSPLTVLIGGNGCGKSTVLQALDFLRSVTFRDIPEYLREKGWSIDDVKSKINDGQKKPIELITTFDFSKNSITKIVEWHLIIDFQDSKWSVRELISVNGKGLIAYRTMPGIFDGLTITNTPEPFKNIKLQSSSLKVIDDYLETVSLGKEEISLLKKFLIDSSAFGILSPEKIRAGNKYIDSTEQIGAGGETLSAFIHHMSPKEKEKLNEIVTSFIGHSFSVTTELTPVNILLYIDEQYEKDGVFVESTIHASHISDGILRLIAFAAIAVSDNKSCGMILLDEIEDGINPYLTQKVIDLLHSIEQNQGRQVVVTTHSPIVLDYIEPDDIVFLWKDEAGASHCGKMFATDKMRHPLNVLSPGEIWINLEKEQILERMGVN